MSLDEQARTNRHCTVFLVVMLILFGIAISVLSQLANERKQTNEHNIIMSIGSGMTLEEVEQANRANPAEFFLAVSIILFLVTLVFLIAHSPTARFIAVGTTALLVARHITDKHKKS